MMKQVTWVSLVVLTCFGLGCPADEGGTDPQPNNIEPADDAGTADMAVEGLNLRRVEPASGNVSGGITVTLSGTGFVDGATVSFGSKDADSVTFLDDTEMRAVVPAGDSEGSVAIIVENPDGESDSIANGFT